MDEGAKLECLTDPQTTYSCEPNPDLDPQPDCSSYTATDEPGSCGEDNNCIWQETTVPFELSGCEMNVCRSPLDTTPYNTLNEILRITSHINRRNNSNRNKYRVSRK